MGKVVKIGDSGIQDRLKVYPAPISYYIPLVEATSINDGSFTWGGFQTSKWRRLKSTSYFSIEAKRVFKRWAEYEDNEEGLATD